MKISLSKDDKGKRDKLKPPLPLEVEPLNEDDETKMACFKLRTTPSDADSPTYLLFHNAKDGWQRDAPSSYPVLLRL